MSQRHPQLPLPITATVQRLRRQIRRYIWLEGLAVALTWMGVAFWLGLALDYLPVIAGANEMPRWARLVMLIAFSLILVYLIHRFIIRRVFVRLADRSLALLLERQFPEFHDTLVTAIDTTIDVTDSEEATLRQAMLNRAIELAAARSQRIDTAEALRYRPLWSKAVSAAIAVISVGLFCWLARDAFATWTSRMLLLSDAPWPRRTHIEVLDFAAGARKVAEGSDVTIRVRAAADRPTPPPELCTIDFQLANGERGRVNMSRDGEERDGYQFYRYQGPPFQGMLETVQFDVIGYDHRVRDLRVDVVTRPSIVDVQLACRLPDYMNQGTRQVAWRPGTSLPVGTRVTLTARATKPLTQVTVRTLESGESQVFDVGDSNDPLAFSYDLAALKTTTSLELELLDHDGVTSQQPYRLAITAVDDLSPQVDVNLLGIGTAITPDARLPMTGEIRDDYQVKEAWFQMNRADENSEHRVPITLRSGGRVEQSLDLRQLRNEATLPWSLEPGDKMMLSIQATDYFDLGETPNLGQSEQFPLDVVTPPELLALLEARELNLKRRFEQTIHELNDTRDSLLRLQAILTEPLAQDNSASSEEGHADIEQDSLSRDSSLRRLRVQRAQQDGSKAQQEVQGVAASFAEIRDELVNNRVDTPERRNRLQDRIIGPLEVVVADDFTRWLDQLTQLEQLVESDGTLVIQNTEIVVRQTNELILALQQVLENMLELETFNELLDLVRSIVKEQEALLDKTKQEQKRQDRAILED